MLVSEPKLPLHIVLVLVLFMAVDPILKQVALQHLASLEGTY